MIGQVVLPIEPPSAAAMLGWFPPPVPLLPVVAVGLAVWYLCAVRIVTLHGRHWPASRTASFLAGCVALAAVTGLAIDGYGYRLFSAFMFQHLTLSILVPPLLVLGAPGRLLLRSTPLSVLYPTLLLWLNLGSPRLGVSRWVRVDGVCTG